MKLMVKMSIRKVDRQLVKGLKLESNSHNNENKENEYEKTEAVNTKCEKDNDSGKKENVKNTKDVIKGGDSCVEIGEKDFNKGAEIHKEDKPQTEYSQPHTQELMKLEWMLLRHETSRNHIKETLKEGDFPLIRLKDIEHLECEEKNRFNEKATIQNENEEDMLLEKCLKNLQFLSTKEDNLPTGLAIDAPKYPQMKKQGVTKSFHIIKLKLVKDKASVFQGVNMKDVPSVAQITLKEQQQCIATEIPIFVEIEIEGNTHSKEKSTDEAKGKNVDTEGRSPTSKRAEARKQQVKNPQAEKKKVENPQGKKIQVEKPHVKKTQTRKQTAKKETCAKSGESKEKKLSQQKLTRHLHNERRKKKEANDKEEMAIHASPISSIPPPVDIENEKRKVKLSNALVSPFYERKVILHNNDDII
ncbi:hypothetical protein Tco_1556380 [Tanacetum coccineum]